MNYFIYIIFVILIYCSNGKTYDHFNLNHSKKDTCKINAFGEVQRFDQSITYFKFKECYSIIASDECTFNKKRKHALFTVLIKKFPNTDINAIKLITKDEIIDIEPVNPDSGILAKLAVRVGNQLMSYNSNDLRSNAIDNLCTIKFSNNDFSIVEIQNNNIWLYYDSANLTIRDLRLENENLTKYGVCADNKETELLPYQYSLLFNSLIDEDCITKNDKNISKLNKHEISYIETFTLCPILEYNNKICLSANKINYCHYQTEPIYLSNNTNNTVEAKFYCINKVDERIDKLKNLQMRQKTLVNAYHNMLAYVKKTNVHGIFVTRAKEYNNSITIIQNELAEIDSAISEHYTELELQRASFFEQVYQIPKLCKFVLESFIIKN